MARNLWPMAVVAVARLRKEGDIGLGDTIVHLIGDKNSDRFKRLFHKIVGRTCGCADRQRWLNARFPYL